MPDWNCARCETINAERAMRCRACGEPAPGADRVALVAPSTGHSAPSRARIFVVLAALFVTAAGAWMLRHRIQYGASGAEGVACFEHIQRNLLDPYSARLSEVSAGDKGEVKIVYRAKNAMGAYLVGRARCIFTDGRLDEGATALAASHDALSHALDAEIARASRQLCIAREESKGSSRPLAEALCASVPALPGTNRPGAP